MKVEIQEKNSEETMFADLALEAAYSTDSGSRIVGLVVRDRDGNEKTISAPTDEGEPEILDEPAAAMRILLDQHGKQLRSKKEHFILLTLDTRRHLIRSHVVSIGTLDSSLVHPRELFRECLLDSASALIVAHNHPSGNPEPSPEDLALTRRLDKAARLLGLKFLDHLVVGKGGKFVSLRERQRSGRLPVELFGEGAF